MKTYPIDTINLEEAKNKQFKLVDIIHQNFNGYEILNNGDLGVVKGIGHPTYTEKVEKTIAQFFNAEASILVRGSGTGAIRNVMNTSLKANQKILLHDAPIYPTTKVIIDSMGLECVFVDFNDLEAIEKTDLSNIRFALIQHSRQKIEDKYDLSEVIATVKKVNKDIEILVDDNYVVMKSDKIGVELGAEASAFSLFKLLGPEGVGCIVGTKKVIDLVRNINYSGGSQVQGFEAMDALRSLVYAPVALAIQAEEGNKIIKKINNKEIPHIKSAFIANAQSRVILVEFDRPIAKEVLKCSSTLGAAPYPVGAESRYEITAMFYRVSGTFLKANAKLEDYMIRINPMRAGSDTVLRILKESVKKAIEKERK
ncbi:aminotransferase class I/II-fold pyridoxal phosphate-dependent enzyme [Clostridiaceae bacterium M8S5]|nr:aminotransferase class I/II-fold pyridoxal phosphate-dependent enzyme [Clostridiaceae bacterium M8S5]